MPKLSRADYALQKARLQLIRSRLSEGADQVGKVVIINDTHDPDQ